MIRSARPLSHYQPKSPLLTSPPLCRWRPIAIGSSAAISLLALRKPSSIITPFTANRHYFSFLAACRPAKMDHSTSAEPSPWSVAAEDYVHVSDSDFREAVPSSDPHADPDLPRSVVGALARSFAENDAASPQVDEDKVIGGLEDSRIGNSGEGGYEESRVLPEELAKGVMHLECESSAEGGHCDVYLVGTAHVSQESCTEVEAVISCLKPEVVFLELCSSRIAILTPQNLKVPTVNEMIDMWKKKKSNTFGILYSWFLAKVADRLEVFPGAEFRVAYEETMSYGGRVVLGDRPVNITLRRTWGKMSIWHRTKFLYYIFFQTFFLPTPEDLRKMLKDMDNVDMLTLVIQEMSKAFPTIMDTVLHERDIVILHGIRATQILKLIFITLSFSA
ncbi:hypothetical protein KSP40_PGU016830 [Platanthera guangdongensis]|uniref:TraB domain-containing protein n=1 Tax=Platanthera guangdongensis TaxID=2320717 RepID=A0ABR2MV83_9ASPA